MFMTTRLKPKTLSKDSLVDNLHPSKMQKLSPLVGKDYYYPRRLTQEEFVIRESLVKAALVLHHLQSKLDDLRPNQHNFLKHREKIIEHGNSPELQEMLRVEHHLRDERASLLNRIEEVKDDEKKKAFAVATAKLIIIENKLRDVTKQLNHRLMESEFVKTNRNKILDDISWLRQRLDEKELELVLDGTNDDSILETTIQKKEKMVALESELTNQMTELRKEEERASVQEQDLELLKEEIKSAKAELYKFQDNKDPELLRRQRDIIVRKESTSRLYEYEKKILKDKIADTKEQIEQEEDTHKIAMEYLENKLSRSEAELDEQNDLNAKEIRQLDILLQSSIERRDSNLKELLQLRVKWENYEKERRESEKEIERMSEADELERRRKEAVEVIRNRLSLLYRSKFKKEDPKSKPKPKKGKKKKNK